MRKLLQMLATLALVLGSSAATADESGILPNWGLSLAAGGGVGQFTDATMRDMTGVAGLWDARVTIGTRTVVGFELGYQGGAQTITALGLDSSAVMVFTAFDADVRLQPARFGIIQPYAFAGLGWKHYGITEATTNTSDINDTNNALEVPMGLGVAATYGHILFDLRGTFRASVTDEGLSPNAAAGNPDLHSWNALLKVGYEF